MNNQSENINELATALSKAQGEMQPVYKDKKVAFETQKNDKIKYKYADLASVWDSCRQPLSKNGLAVVQTMQSQDGSWVLTTTLIHSSGQWMKSMLPINVNAAPTALGSSISYMRRYALCAMVSIAPEDDDAQEANKDYEKSINSQKIYPAKQQEQCVNSTNITDKITVDQVKEVLALSKQVDETCRTNMEAYLLKEFQISSYEDIPQKAFQVCVRAMKNNIDLQKNNSKQQVA